MDKSNDSQLNKEIAKFKTYCKQLRSKNNTFTKYNITLSIQKLTNAIQQLNTPSIVPTLFDIWDCALSIFDYVEKDISFYNFITSLLIHPQFYATFLIESERHLYSKYREHAKETLQFIFKGINSMGILITLPSPSIRGTADSLRTQISRQTASMELSRPEIIPKQQPKKKSFFSRFKKEKETSSVNLSPDFIPFAVKIIAIAFIRLPDFRREFVKFYEKILNYTSKWQKKKRYVDPFPTFYNWDVFNEGLLTMMMEINYSFLENEAELFVMILYEIATSLEKITQHKIVQWTGFEGFDVLLEVYKHYYSKLDYEQEYVHLLDGILVVSTSPQMINFYMNNVLHKTNIFNHEEVFNAIGNIEYYFSKYQSKLMVLTGKFNIELLCQFIDEVLESEHLLTLQKLLNVLYVYGDLFAGNVKQYFFIDYLLGKRFNEFAFFWEENVISIFMQLIFFKGSIAKRRHLRKNKLTSYEESMYDYQRRSGAEEPMEVDKRIIETARRRFKNVDTQKLTYAQRRNIQSFEKMFAVMKTNYDNWENSEVEKYPDVFFVHSLKEKDEMDMK